jgi:hypothetical protein
MSKVFYASGRQIYNAAVAGAKCGYNRSTDDHCKYSEFFCQYLKLMLDSITNESARREFLNLTKNDWKKAYFPISLALVHKHKAGVPCESHARVYLRSKEGAVFDIPMEKWDLICKESARLLP